MLKFHPMLSSGSPNFYNLVLGQSDENLRFQRSVAQVATHNLHLEAEPCHAIPT